MIFSRILCPTDFSESSLKTVALALTMKGAGEILLLHVVRNSEKNQDLSESVRTAELRIKALCDQKSRNNIKPRGYRRDRKTRRRDHTDRRGRRRIPDLDALGRKGLSSRLLLWQHGA